MSDWTPLDKQMARWMTRLCDDVKLSVEQSAELATAIQADVAALSDEAKRRVAEVSPVPVQARLDELVSFQAWMDLVNSTALPPSVVRAQVITQNYLCFVYLKDALFDVLRREVASGSATRKTCQYLLNNSVRAFRNAIAHGNWAYSSDFLGIDFWAHKGGEATQLMSQFHVSQDELSFWQALSRSVAYTAFAGLT